LIIDFGFVRVNIIEKNLSYKYKPDFNTVLNHTSFETKMKKSVKQTSGHWTATTKEKWAQSNLSLLLKKPDADKVQNLNDKTLALKIMSLDMNTAERTDHSTTKIGRTGSLPPLKK